MKPKQKDLNPIDEAYKMVSGDPGIDAVSKAAMGETPMSDEESRVDDFNKKQDPKAAIKSTPGVPKVSCDDIDEAYAKLFEGLAAIMRHSHESSEPAEESAEDPEEDED